MQQGESKVNRYIKPDELATTKLDKTPKAFPKRDHWNSSGTVRRGIKKKNLLFGEIQ